MLGNGFNVASDGHGCEVTSDGHGYKVASDGWDWWSWRLLVIVALDVGVLRSYLNVTFAT